MPPIVAPGICRFATHGRIFDRPWVAILDMHIESGGIGGREDNIIDQAKVLNNEWIDHFRPLLTSSWFVDGTRWVDLDTLNGSTGDSTQVDAPRVLPSAGGGVANGMSPNVALLIKKISGGGRATRSGRMYLCGITETQVEGNNIPGANLTPFVNACSAFLSAINQSGATSFGGYDSHLVVVHTVGGSFVDHDSVTQLLPQSRPATQRRRLRA